MGSCLSGAKCLNSSSLKPAPNCRWQQTLVAAKLLLNTGIAADNPEAVQQALTLSNPVLEKLQKARVRPLLGPTGANMIHQICIMR